MKNYSANNIEIINTQAVATATEDTRISADLLLQENLAMLKKLRMPQMAKSLSESFGESHFMGLGFLQQMNVLLSSEITSRADSGYHRRLKKAQLACSATPELIRERLKDYGLSASAFEYLMSSRWIEEGKEVIIIGKSGLGKTDLASAMLDAACRNGLTARHFDYSMKMFELTEYYASGGSTELYHQTLAEMSGNSVVMLDDVCLGVKREGEATVFKDVMSELRERHRCGLILISQKSPDEWHRFLGGDKIADAVLDRVLNRSYLIKLDGDSKRASKPDDVNGQGGSSHDKD